MHQDLPEAVRLAQQEVAGLRSECVASGALAVDDEMIVRVGRELITRKSKVRESKQLLWVARFRYVIARLKLIVRLLRLFLRNISDSLGLPPPIVAMFAGTACFLVGLAICAPLGVTAAIAVGLNVLGFAFGFFFALRLLYASAIDLAVSEYVEIGRQIDGFKDLLSRNLTLCREAESRLDKLQTLRQLREKYDDQDRALSELIAELNDRRNVLLRENWRALRGIPFEEFLVQVFEVLGFNVETTKASGDQGIDLIASRTGERIGIQAKGYEGSVGNFAVQAAVAGMIHYRCTRCAVITNSAFTKAARDLALSTGCLLVDEDALPDLIRGKVIASAAVASP